MNNTLLMLVRREIWEHRSLWITPLALAGVLLIIAALGGVHFNDGGNFWVGSNDALANMSPAERERALASMAPDSRVQHIIVAGVFSMLTVVQLLVLGIVVFFYLLDTLLAERRDRSILFWKSLPVSDGQVVASKALTALVAAPLFVMAVSAVSLLLFSLIASIRMSGMPFSPWNAQSFLDVQLIALAFVPMIVLWYLPLAGYLLLISVWVRKNAFLWALLPPVGLLIIEQMLTHSNFVAEFLGARFAGYVQVMDASDLRDFDDLKDSGLLLGTSFRLIGQVFASYQLWVGAVAGVALIYAAARIRRLRDDS
jgi:ABC-2 type transport system permease protein